MAAAAGHGSLLQRLPMTPIRDVAPAILGTGFGLLGAWQWATGADVAHVLIPWAAGAGICLISILDRARAA